MAKKKYAEADELLRKSAETFTAQTGVSGPHTQAAIKARIELYQNPGRTAEARAQEALLAQAAKPGP